MALLLGFVVSTTHNYPLYFIDVALTWEEEAESVLSRSRRPNFGLFNQSIIDISVFLNFCLCFNSQEILCVLIVSDAQ